MSKFLCLVLFYLITFTLISCTNPLVKPSANLSQAADDNVQLGLMYLRADNHQSAKQKLLLAVQQAPHSSVALDALAYFFERTGDTVAAEQYYKQAIRLSSNSGMALNNYGGFLCRTQRYSIGLTYLLKAAAQANYLNSAEAYENAGLCALNIPDKMAANNYFHKAIQQDPKRTMAKYLLKLLKNDAKQAESLQKT